MFVFFNLACSVQSVSTKREGAFNRFCQITSFFNFYILYFYKFFPLNFKLSLILIKVLTLHLNNFGFNRVFSAILLLVRIMKFIPLCV